MIDQRRMGDAAFVSTILGCIGFFTAFSYAAYRIYVAYRSTGIPVHGSSGVIGTLDALWAAALLEMVAAALTGVIAWRAVLARRRRS
jgi:hypothetical protein